MLALQASAGNQAVVRMLARDFNPGSVVHDLRRAIDQAEVQLATMKRKVDVALVIRVLDGLTPEQISEVKRLYSDQEGTTLDNDLFEGGQSGLRANLKPDQEARIRTLLKGAGARLEAVAIELHELLSGTVDEGKRERVMAIYKRPRAQIEVFESHYERRYGHGISMDLVLKLPGVQLSRVMALRAGNAAQADAYAIEDKRRTLEDLERKKDAKDLSISEAMSYEKSRRRLIDGITGIADANRQVLAAPGAKPGQTVADQLADTLKGTEAAGILAATSRVEVAARRLLEMEARDTTSSGKIRELIEDLREHAERQKPPASPAHYIDAFKATYNRLKPADGRTWAQIVASADSENEEMLNALTAGAGKLAPVDELRFAIRKKDAARINAVLRGQRTRDNVKRLEEAYNAKFKPDLRKALFGILGEELPMVSPTAVRGRDAALTHEYLNAPEKLGGEEEADWIAASAQREAKATRDSSGIVGSLRDLGDDPETKQLMEESATRMRELRKRWTDEPGRRDAILAEMKQVRATLTGDAVAYEDENEQMRAQIRSAVSLAVQVGLALALPGVGTGLTGLISTTAVNIAATVASNAVIYGDKYTLKSLYDDVVGGALGALGGKLGEDVAKLAGKAVLGDAAEAVTRAMTEAGQSPEVIKRFARAAELAQDARLSMRALAEAGNIAGSTAATSAATGNDGFTADELLQSFLMNRLGLLRGKPGAAAGDEARAKPEGPSPRTDAPGRFAAETARLEGGLPADLQGRRMVVVDGALKPGDVEVHYQVLPPGVVGEIHLRVGEGTDPRVVRDHVSTVRAMQRYAGFSGRLRALMRRATEFLTGHPQAGPGTKAWEARLEIDKLRQMVSDRVRDLAQGAGEPDLHADIANLEAQLQHYERVLDAIERDPAEGLAPGKGHVDAKSAKTWESEKVYAAVSAEIRAIKAALRDRPDLIETFESVAREHDAELRVRDPEAPVGATTRPSPGFEDWVRSIAGRDADSLRRELTDARRRIKELAANRFPPEDGVAPPGWTPPPQDYRRPPKGRMPNANALPFPTELQQRAVDDYVRGLAEVRGARERLVTATTPKQHARVMEERRRVDARLDALEALAEGDYDLYGHLVGLIQERQTLAGPGGPGMTRVGEIETGPIATVGGRLRGLSYADVRARLGEPSYVKPPLQGDKGRDPQAGSGIVEWKIYDPLTGMLSGTIRLDVPTPDSTRTEQSADNPHLARLLPGGEIHIDEQGVVVPYNTTSAHLEIAEDQALLDEFAKARGRE